MPQMRQRDLEIKLQKLTGFESPKAYLEQYMTPATIAADILFRALANGDVHDAHYGCVLGHLMNNSYRLGKKMPFNLKSGQFGDNPDAYEHFAKLHEVMSNGVGIPEDGNEYIVGPWLTFDPKTERFTGDNAEMANKLLKDDNRPGFEIPASAEV